MIAEKRDRKARRRFMISSGAYAMGYFGTFICYKMNVSEDITADVFFIFTLIGVLSAAAYGSLPQARLSEKAIHELEEMLEKMKNEEVEERNILEGKKR